ncbi:MAG: glycosyltransferase family 4 protein [Rhodospirillales bacterium]|nr:glycosyltransferase family 4 protein [Rhodospirillales bacterium]
MTLPALATLCLSVFAAVLVATGLVVRILERRAILDQPNERSSHTIATPRGAGWSIIPILLAGWLAAANALGALSAPVWWICALAVALGAISWLDDLRGLSPVIRLLGQAIAVAVALVAAAPSAPYFGGLLPGALDPIAAALLWIWYINLFNFMDGIDGITGIETACTGLGVALVAIVSGMAGTETAFGLVAACAAIAFLWWNWHPAKIFLGDIGSVPLGFLLGWLLLDMAAQGQWAAALILPAYYLADATVTLFRRAMRGEKVWRPHREHYYQQAVQKGASHARVSLCILAANLVLIALAVLAALGWIWPALAGMLAVVAGLLIFLRGGAGAVP